MPDIKANAAVQVEDIQSTDRLAENAETFIKLQKYNEAMNLYIIPRRIYSREK